MKKLIIMLVMVTSMIVLLPSNFVASAKSLEDDPVIIFSSSTEEDSENVKIAVKLKENTGICAMNLTLKYNSDAMKLVNVVKGSALSSLDLTTTNTQTELGYAITPFIFNYFGADNDSSIGQLFELEFKINDTARDGAYEVSFAYKKNSDVNYYDGTALKTKNLFIDSAKINILSNKAQSVEIVSYNGETPNQSNIVLIVSIILAVILIIGLVCFLIFRKRNKGNWQKL